MQDNYYLKLSRDELLRCRSAAKKANDAAKLALIEAALATFKTNCRISETTRNNALALLGELEEKLTPELFSQFKERIVALRDDFKNCTPVTRKPKAGAAASEADAEAPAATPAG